MTREEWKILKETLQKVGYACGTYAFYDAENDAYYNDWGQRLRDPIEYEPDEDGCYTPFGDE